MRVNVREIIDLSQNTHIDPFNVDPVERLPKRHNVSPFKGDSTGMRRRGRGETWHASTKRCFTAHANARAENLKCQLGQRWNANTGRLPGFPGDSIRSVATVRDDSRRTKGCTGWSGLQFERVFCTKPCPPRKTTMPLEICNLSTKCPNFGYVSSFN